MARVVTGEASSIITTPNYRPARFNGQLHVASLSLLSGISLGTLTPEELAQQAIYQAAYDWSLTVSNGDVFIQVPPLYLLVDATTTPQVIPYQEGGRALLGAARALAVPELITVINWVDQASIGWNAWVDSTYLDCVATAVAAQCVVLRPLDESEPESGTNPKVPKIEPDHALANWASLILYRDAVAKLTQPPGFFEHEAFEIVARDRGIDIDASLRALIAGQNTLPGGRPLVGFGGGGGFAGAWPSLGSPPRNRNYSPATAKASAALLNEYRAVRQAASVALDAGLAAACATTWSDARAARLVFARAMSPLAGFV